MRSDDRERRKKCHVPEERTFMKHWELVDELYLQVRDLPHFCVLADSEFGRCGPWRDRLGKRGERYILDIPTNLKVQVVSSGRIDPEPITAADWVARQPPKAWLRIQTRVGSQGPMVFSACRTPVVTLRKNKTLHREILSSMPLPQPDPAGAPNNSTPTNQTPIDQSPTNQEFRNQ